jgi:DNA recombination protein RmuC
MVALARLIAYGWRQEQSATGAQEIAELGRELHRRLIKVTDLVADVGHSIAGSVKSYGALVGSLEARVYPQIRRFKELGGADPGLDVVDPPDIPTPRQLQAPEQLELMPPAQSAPRGRSR